MGKVNEIAHYRSGRKVEEMLWNTPIKLHKSG